jgi:hypothetical protein
MKIIFLFLLFLPVLAGRLSFPQEQQFEYAGFTVSVNEKKISAASDFGIELFEKSFNHPNYLSYDLDEDGVDEIVVIDTTFQNENPFYTIFIFNTIDSFYLCDSIYSGTFPPYFTTTEEFNGKIIIAGNSLFEKYNNGTEDFFLPVNIFSFEECEVYNLNNEIYDFFITENEQIIDYIENYFSFRKDCASAKLIKGAIAAGYINYLNAGEVVSANQFLSRYYLCDDINSFKPELNHLYKKEKNYENGLE